MENGNGKKLGLYKKLGTTFSDTDTDTDTDTDSEEISIEIATMFETGQIENILGAIDNIVNGEANLPAGEKSALFKRIREVGKGYTVIGTN